MRGSKLLHMIHPMVSVGTKPPLVHVVVALTQEYFFQVTKYLPRTPLDSPQRLASTKEHHLVTLMSPPLRSFSTEEGVSTLKDQSGDQGGVNGSR
jgi:hypothetical protein